MEFLPGKPVQVYYFMDALDKKILVKTLSADLKLLLIQPQEDGKSLFYDGPSGNNMAVYRHKGKRDYYVVSAVTGKPVHAYLVSTTSKKARVDYYSRDGMQIDSVTIVHYNVNLRIGMRFINENPNDAAK
jgi:myo-inositol-hexaphosphate 3-phosphohydrolase